MMSPEERARLRTLADEVDTDPNVWPSRHEGDREWMVDASAAIKALLDELQQLEQDLAAADERMAGILDGTFAIGDGTAQTEIERLRKALAEVAGSR